MKLRWESDLDQIGSNKGETLYCRVPAPLFGFQFPSKQKVESLQKIVQIETIEKADIAFDFAYQNIMHSILAITNALPPGRRLASVQDSDTIPDSCKISGRYGNGKCVVLKKCP